MSDAYRAWPRKAATNETASRQALDAIFSSRRPRRPAARCRASQAACRRQPLGVLPQSQPAALGAAAPPMGAMGPVGGPMQPGLRLPGITPPGQLPLGMGPQQQQPGQQGVQQPY